MIGFLIVVGVLAVAVWFMWRLMSNAPYGYEDETGFHECHHEWVYDEKETNAGPWTGYIESCPKCGAILQVPQ